jgi:exosortase
MSALNASARGPEMISTGGDGTIATPGSGDPLAPRALQGSRAWWWALLAATGALALAYAPNFRDLAYIWSRDENYSHGFLVVPIALFILRRRLKEDPWEGSADIGAAPWLGWGLLAAALVARSVAYELGFYSVEHATLLPALVGLVWAFGGPSLLSRTWPAILFLVFMLPLPSSINSLIALPLQRLAATGSYFSLQLAGFWVVQHGNMLHLTTPFGTKTLDVAIACSGLKMLMTLAATVTATILLIPLPGWKRIVLLASAVPIALFSNLVRIVVTGWCYYYIKGEAGGHWAHDISGLMMMPLALVLVLIELKLLSWLAPERAGDDDDDRKAILLLEGNRADRKVKVLDEAELQRRRQNLRPLPGGKGKDGTAPPLDE